MTLRVAIVGGGISGLAALEYLTRVEPSLPVTLLEASPRLGGHIRSERSGGFLMEAGPDVILAAKPAAVELARRVGIGDRLQGTNPAARGSYIMSGAGLRRMPDGMTGLVPSRMMPFVTTPLISPLGKLRVGMEYLIPPKRDAGDESIEEFVVRRLGREMYQRLVEPLLSGISAGDGAKLSMRAMFPQLVAYESEYGGLVRGMLRVKREQRQLPPRRQEQREQEQRRQGQRNDEAKATANHATANTAPSRMGFLSFPEGLQELVTAVEREVRRRDPAGTRIAIRTGARVERIERAETAPGESAGYRVLLANGEALAADAVIMATAGYVSAAALRGVDEELAALLREIEYASTVTISVAYPESAVPKALDATGYVAPRVFKRDVLACTWVSSKFNGRAPAGHVLFRLFLGGAGRGSYIERGDAELLEIVRREMREVMGIAADPELVQVNRFDRAMPQYNVGHLERVARIAAQAARHPGIALAGAASGGVGIPDCVKSGERAATAVLAWLAQRHPTEVGSKT
ncbi:MAG: protoporphyrinogen oxidase [Gemmatimonadota bacterium]|nr:protoporphyrinogen oxidase [Gemmatimonadota bacterium]